MPSQAPLSALRSFIRPRTPEERCDTCGAPLAAEHIHQLDLRTQQIRCACNACASVAGESRPTIPRRVLRLPEFQLTDAQWNDLSIPISLAFFTYSSTLQRATARYPGPAGVTESTLDLDAWEMIAEDNREVREMKPDVEALLVNRIGATREYYLVPIDECYRLAGLIRVHWRGLGGGAAVWGEVARFYEDLRRKGQQSCTA